MTTATRDLHLVRLPVHEVEDLIEAIRYRASRPGVTSEKYNQGMQAVRWLEKRLEGVARLADVDLLMSLANWERVAEIAADAEMRRVAKKILRDTAEGD